MSPRRLTLALLCLLLTACAGPSAPATVVSIPSVPPPPPTSVPPLAIPLDPHPTLAPPVADAALTAYTLDVLLDYRERTAQVYEIIDYVNRTGQPLEALVLGIEPNRYPSAFHLDQLFADGLPVEGYRLGSNRLDLPLAAPLAPGAAVRIEIRYRLDLPWVDVNTDPNRSGQIFGWTARQLNLVEWYPFVVPFQDGDWLLHQAWSYGEHLVYDAADFDISLAFSPGNPSLTVAASGQPAGARRWVLRGGRTFALSFSDQFELAETRAGDVLVRSYYFPEHAEAGLEVLQVTAEALQLYEDLFGPYPHATLSAVEGLHGESMEYSGFHFINRDLYSQYDGTPRTFLVIIAAHETAHQWWFGLVGSDQAEEPWLDEGLATFCELLYYESIHPDLVEDWWWRFRIEPFDLQGWVDTRLYDQDRVYGIAVYLRGALFMDDLRQRVGQPAFAAFLRDYTAQFTGRRATAGDFFGILRQHTDQDLSDLTARYFREPH